MFRLFVLIMILICPACTPSEKKTEGEEYPDFSEEESTPVDQTMTMCGSQKVSRKHYHVVEICQMKFIPADLRINHGDTVEWINRDITNHDVTEEPSKAWQSPPLIPGKSWRKVMTSSAEYYCSIHVVMKGAVTVGETP